MTQKKKLHDLIIENPEQTHAIIQDYINNIVDKNDFLARQYYHETIILKSTMKVMAERMQLAIESIKDGNNNYALLTLLGK